MDETTSPPTSPSPENAKKALRGPLLAVLALAVLGIGYALFNRKPPAVTNGTLSGDAVPETTEPAAPSTPTPAEPDAQAPETSAPAASAYADGTYTAVGNYVSPGGPEQVGVTLTLEDGVVVDSQFEIKAQRPISKEKQTIFSQNYKPLVVGKNINEVKLTKVSSSSLSPKGFNDAVEQIKQQARS